MILTNTKTGKITKFIIAAKLSSVFENDATSIPIPEQVTERVNIPTTTKSQSTDKSMYPRAKSTTINNVACIIAEHEAAAIFANTIFL